MGEGESDTTITQFTNNGRRAIKIGLPVAA